MKPSCRFNAALSAALLFDSATAQAATSGKFNVLSMNVAGLPAWLNNNGVPGDKTEVAALIGTKFAESGYDVIQVQEDFNYHAHIYRTDTHPYRTPTSGGVPIGSGLNTLSNLPWTSFRRIKWDKCSDISAADCFTPKGFTFMRIALSGGDPSSNSTTTYTDFYNIHADAGTSSADFKARQSNIAQVASYISLHSTGNAVVIYGDLNSLYSRADTAVRALLDGTSAAGPGWHDVWVDLVKGGVVPPGATQCGVPAVNEQCETLDKVIYRQADGSVLTDHNPVWAVLKHGGEGGTEVSLVLAADEYWTVAELCKGEKSDKERNFYIRAFTSKGRNLAAGTATGDCKTFEAPEGWQIVGYLGQAGEEVDQLAFVYGPQ
ncbi:hypothetical protein N0V88_000677 [Collariella sp. IMI 366227]|nr:hypothetical protein N0V88_000677 [Collariella sp. IMI 366227]